MPRLPVTGGDASTLADIDALIAAYYAAFDNRASRAPAIGELRAMFTPGASITCVALGKVDTWTVEAFIAPRAAMLSNGELKEFHEWELDAQTVAFDNIASRRSLYGKSGVRNGEPFQGDGRKFISLARTEDGWRISSILWEDA